MELEENLKPTSALSTSDGTQNSQNNKKDVTDVPPRSSRISNWDIFFLVVSVFTHCTDVCVDVNIVIQYYLNEKLQMFIWTISLILIPSFINTVVSLHMYQQDEQVKPLQKCILNTKHAKIVS